MLKQPNAAGSRARPDTISLGEPHCRVLVPNGWGRQSLAIDRSILCKRYNRLLFRKPHFQLCSSTKINFLIHTSFSLNTSESSTKQTQSCLPQTKCQLPQLLQQHTWTQVLHMHAQLRNDSQRRSGRESEATSVNGIKKGEGKEDSIISKLSVLKVLPSLQIFFFIVKKLESNFTNVG